MAILLHIDTATEICSVALSHNDQLISYIDLDEGYSHSEKLLPTLQKLLAAEQLTLNQIDCFSLAIGPGSYTGLRIGTATVKGLAYALNKPVVTANSLRALYFHPEAQQLSGTVIPLIDARRMEVYTEFYTPTGEILKPVHSHILKSNDFTNLPRPVFLIGNGAQKAREVFIDRPEIQSLPEIKSTARGLITPAFEAFTHKKFEDTAYFEPFYLKDFIPGKPRKMT